ncbi:MAG: hypothetical protein Q9227_004059 [Pyrenula ochraceoflavens]
MPSKPTLQQLMDKEVNQPGYAVDVLRALLEEASGPACERSLAKADQLSSQRLQSPWPVLEPNDASSPVVMDLFHLDTHIKQAITNAVLNETDLIPVSVIKDILEFLRNVNEKAQTAFRVGKPEEIQYGILELKSDFDLSQKKAFHTVELLNMRLLEMDRHCRQLIGELEIHRSQSGKDTPERRQRKS